MASTGTDSQASQDHIVPTMTDAPADVHDAPTKKSKGSLFWLSFSAIIVCNFLSALDVTAVSTVLPTITAELHGGDKFVWVSAAYGLAAAAVMPFTARLADILGRRPTIMCCVALFFLGSALAGSAQNMNWLIAARSKHDLV